MREVVVLLVDPASLPGRLEEVLLEKGMFVESCEVEQASGTLLVSTPDVVIAGYEKLGEVARAVRGSSDSGDLRLLVMAPRGEVAKLRRNLPDEVTAVLPLDLPPAAVAVRVKTVIKRGMEGGDEGLMANGLGTRERRSGGVATRTPAVNNGLSPSPIGKTLPHIPAIPEASVSTAALGKGTERARPSASPKSPPPAPIFKPTAPASASVAQRISLRVPAASLPVLRIAVLDEDVTRADAISTALRKSGHDVFLVSGRTGRARWHLLRKFAPQAIVVDEAGLSHDGGAWIAAFRSDRFLQSTPLVAVALENLFNTEEGEADLSLLEPQLNGLGRTEVTFLAQFGPGRELEVNLSQIGFARLLRLAADSGWPTTFEVQSRTESLLWNVVSGSADAATLKSGSTRIELGAQQALDWVLGHASARVLIRVEDGVKLRGGVLVDELLKEAYRANLPPDAAFSAPNGPAQVGSGVPVQRVGPSVGEQPSGERREDVHDSIPPDSELIQVEDLQAPSRFNHQESTHALVNKDSVPPSSLRRNTPPGFVRAVVGPSARKGLTDKLRWVGAAALVLAGGSATWMLASGEPSAAVEGAAGREGPEAELASAPSELDAVPAPEAREAEVDPKKGDPNPKGQSKDPATDTGGRNVADLWRVHNVVKMDDCDVLLERPLDYYTSQPEWEGEKIWKRARHQLLIGEREAANRLMCQAAFIDPDGRASVGLGEYYLANRSLETAKEWAQYGIEQRPEGARSSQELLGDVYSQMGLPEKAKEQWLVTMKLELDDLPKLRTVARTLARLGQTARRGGDSSLAERLFRRAATLDEDNSEASGGLASALLKNGEPELAEKWARRTLSLDASSGDALLVLGDIARERGDIDAARREYNEIKRGTSAFRVAQERLGEL